MLTYVFYTKNSDHERQAADFAKALERSRVEVKLVEADSTEGVRLTEVYDLMARPAVVVVGPGGGALATWQHELPPVNEVSYAAHQ